MNDLLAMQISSSGMSAQRVRMRVIAENLANQHTVGPDGPYQRKDVLLESIPMSEFGAQMNVALSEFLTSQELETIHAVGVQGVQPDGAPPQMRYEPRHPLADEKGYVAYPNISIIREMGDLMEATRSYEANLAAARATRQMIERALELLG